MRNRVSLIAVALVVCAVAGGYASDQPADAPAVTADSLPLLLDAPQQTCAADAELDAVPSDDLSLDVQFLADPELEPGGEQCGGVICPVGTHCCNASCNWCVPPDMSCPQVSCN